MSRHKPAAIALDLGTTALKAGWMDECGALHDIISRPAPKVSASDGRYESDAEAYASSTEELLDTCIAAVGNEAPLGLCSQRSSFLIWEKSTGTPLTPLISWQDTRGAAVCQALKNAEPEILDLTGLRLTPYYFAPKLNAVLQERPEWRTGLLSGKLLTGTLDVYLLWRLSAGRCHITDASMAARTLLMDVRRGAWSQRLGEIFDLPIAMLPRITPSCGLNVPLANGLKVQASIGDQSAALIACGTDDSVLINLGTGGFVIRMQDAKDFAPDGYLRTLVYRDKDDTDRFAVEGTLNSIAAALAPYPAAECRFEDLGANRIYSLSEPSGLGAPYFRSELNLRFSQAIEHLSPHETASLLLEAIIFRVARILEDFHQKNPIKRVYLSGGLSELNCLQQGIALCAPCAVFRLTEKDASLAGAARLAAGMPDSRLPAAEKICVARANDALLIKYRGWKDWLDGLLKT